MGALNIITMNNKSLLMILWDDLKTQPNKIKGNLAKGKYLSIKPIS